MNSNVFSGIENIFQSSNYITPRGLKPVVVEEKDKEKKVLETIKEFAPIVVPLVTIPLTAGITYKLATKNVKALHGQIDNLEKTVQTLQDTIAKQAQETATQVATREKIDPKIWTLILGLAGLGAKFNPDKFSDEDKDVVINTAVNRVNNIERASAQATQNSNIAMQANGLALSSKYTDNDFSQGISLLTNNGAGRNNILYEEAISKIKNAGKKYLSETPKVNPLPQNATIWSVTSEFAPIKEGGLGSVPVEIQDNAAKLGVNMPTFIPMYQQKGIATFKQEGENYTYTYKNKEYKLAKVATFKLDTFQGGKSKIEDVEIYTPIINPNDENAEELKKRQLVFIKNNTYFNGSIYNTNIKTEEAEKFAFFSKAVYEFAKAKLDENCVKDLSIVDRNAFDAVKEPDAFILNDWQASPIAALARYKAPMENAYGQLNDDASKKLSDINIITIGHNAAYQGSTRNNNNDVQRQQVTTNILNTLFDEFSSDIVRNASSGAVESNPDDKGLENIDNVLLLNKNDKHANHTNLLNMGVSLSNYFHPVSENYAKELIKEPDKSGELMWAMTQRNKSGSLIGIINGNDFDRLSIEAKKSCIKEQTGLDFKTYNKSTEIANIMNAREYNKANLYNNYMVPLSKSKRKGKLEFVDPKNNTQLTEMTFDELSKTPIITSVGRLVSQKGIDIMADAIAMLLDNWEKDFPNKNKPIFYLAGSDGEGGKQRKHLENLKLNKLSEEDSKRVIFAHGFAPMSAITAASDFFLLPSRFEPCGLTQGEAFAVGTPVIGSAVGGIVDTVNRNGKTNGILTPAGKELTAENFYKAMKDALNIYFNNPDEYQQMVKNSLDEDFSWIQPDKQGPIYDYLERAGINRKELP